MERVYIFKCFYEVNIVNKISGGGIMSKEQEEFEFPREDSDIYTEEGMEEMVEDDEIDAFEAAFMRGYMDLWT